MSTNVHARWKLTEEAKNEIPAWNRRWVEIIRRTTQMSEDERGVVASAIRDMYRLAGLDGDNLRIVFVSSPLMAATVAGAATAWWHQHERAATYAATRAATRAATDDDTDAATRAATRAATDAATRATTRAATDDDTDAATRGATRAATDAAFITMLSSALRVVGDTRLARSCIARTWNMRNGGNQWASWCCFLSFVRDVVGWSNQVHKKYAVYETVAIHSGPRYMHPRFCIVSDFPTLLAARDDGGTLVAHSTTGPSHAWADGFAIWMIDGVRVDEQIVLHPETQTVEQINRESNEEVRRIRIERFGWERYLTASQAAIVEQRINERDGQAERLYRMHDGRQRFVCIDPSTGRRYALGVPREIVSCQAAQDWMSHDLDRLAIHRS